MFKFMKSYYNNYGFFEINHIHFCLAYTQNMAKWGEGDPRWIVEERPDATNVNNWHW